MLSICRGKRTPGNNVIRTCYGPCGLNHQQLVEHEVKVCYLLCRLIPGAHVVKAFNTLSAWALQNGPLDASRQVLNVSVSDILFLNSLYIEKQICLKLFLLFLRCV